MQSAQQHSDVPLPEDNPRQSGMAQEYRDDRSWKTRLPLLVIAVVIFAAAFITYEREVDSTNFHPDESRWINRAHYLADLADPFGPTWNDQYLTRGQPPMGSYVMGLGLWLQGVDLDTNYAWDYRRGREWNVQNGMYPTPEELRAGRMTNVVLGSIAVVVSFFAVRLLSNTAGGIVAAVILIAHPLQAWHNRLALADTTLTLTLASLVLMTILLLRRPGWFRTIAVGFLIGLGGANKLTPLALAFVLAAVGAVMLVRAVMRNRASLLPGETWTAAIPGHRHLSWMLISTPAIAGVTFVAVYPYLWKQPIVNTLLVLDFRQNEMEEQARLFSRFAVESTSEAISRTWASLAERWSATEWLLTQVGLPELGSQLAPLDLVLAIFGAGVVLLVSSRLSPRSGHLVVGILLLVQVTTIVLAMRTDFERYYLPIVLAVAIFAGIGVGVATGVVTAAIRANRRTRQGQSMQARGVAHPRAGTSES